MVRPRTGKNVTISDVRRLYFHSHLFKTAREDVKGWSGPKTRSLSCAHSVIKTLASLSQSWSFHVNARLFTLLSVSACSAPSTYLRLSTTCTNSSSLILRHCYSRKNRDLMWRRQHYLSRHCSRSRRKKGVGLWHRLPRAPRDSSLHQRLFLSLQDQRKLRDQWDGDEARCRYCSLGFRGLRELKQAHRSRICTAGVWEVNIQWVKVFSKPWTTRTNYRCLPTCHDRWLARTVKLQRPSVCWWLALDPARQITGCSSSLPFYHEVR